MKNKSSDKSKASLGGLIAAYPVTTLFIIISSAFCGITFLYNYKTALCELAALGVLFIITAIVRHFQFKQMIARINVCQKFVSTEKGEGLEYFPLPALVYSGNKIIWCNTAFKENVVAGSSPQNDGLLQFTSGVSAKQIDKIHSFECEYNGKQYTVFHNSAKFKKETLNALYFVEDTELKAFRILYENSKPVVMFMTLDFTEENFRNLRESQISEITSGAESIIENWFADYDCITKRLGNGKIMLITDVENAKRMKHNKFSVLSLVRNHSYGDKNLGMTLSVGASGGSTIAGCETGARQALDMALGRGGDQVAYNNGENNYEFFGGVSQSSEKRAKVRTRVMASAICQTIEAADNVLVMGHRNSDLDAVGSAVGVAEICNYLGKECRIVVDLDTTLAKPLVNHLTGTKIEEMFVSPAQAETLVNENTLLVIVDTHRQSFLEAPKIFNIVNKVIVIDHHRKIVDHISKAVIFYHEPNVSSASEMVTELIEYMGENITLPRKSAEALLSGIMLDTKNFVMKTGVATFEAAAFLRSAGADTISVKQLFANSLKTQKEKSEVVKNSVIFGGSAVGVVDFDSQNVRIIAGQAADELLNVDGVKASYILFKTGNTINISARSYGEVNVQLVMENMGGGGHKTMAACQLKDASFESALNELKKSINTVKSINE